MLFGHSIQIRPQFSHYFIYERGVLWVGTGLDQNVENSASVLSGNPIAFQHFFELLTH